MQKLLTLCLALCLAVSLAAQNAPNFFTPVSESQIALRGAAERVLVPEKYTTYQIDFEGFRQSLVAAPAEFTAAAKAGNLRLALPEPDGQIEEFAVWQTAMMEPELAAKYPEIRTYAGQSLREPGKILRLTVCPQWMRARVLTPDAGAQFVEVFAKGQNDIYMAYDRRDIPAEVRRSIPPGTAEHIGSQVIDDVERFAPTDSEAAQRGTLLAPVELKVYRFAVATTGEFSQDNGTTVAEVLAKVVDVTNQVSGVFERDIQIRLQLINNSDYLIFMDPLSDPFFGTTVQEFAAQNATVLNTRIGFGGYDIGHVYCRYLGGSAGGVSLGLGIVCGANKAGGCTAGGGTYGDGFEATVGQETGHQLNGGHTWNRCGPTVSGRNGTSAFEPGSGSTIMSYAGSCGSDNIAFDSDLYYHAGSIEEIKLYTITGTGNQCGSKKSTTNNHPIATLPYQNGFFIPISTPFELKGSATDPDGDDAALTYCWEQVDYGPETPLEAPVGSCPLFRTFPAVAAPNRYFPRLQTILTNGFNLAEQLPTYSRQLTFRMTIRDNRAEGGGLAWQDVEFKSTDSAGPFLVKSPNTANEVWRVGEYVNVTWDVANTDRGLVNCKTVNIRLSTDGGQTYPITLASGVANDGSQLVLVPDNVTNTARVRVEAADNVFFDLSNANFKIQQPAQPALSLGVETDGAQICLPTVFSTQVLSVGLLGFDTPVSLAFSGVPPGATASLGTSTLTPGENTTFQIDFSNVNAEAVYTVELLAFAAGIDTVRRPIALTTVSNDFSQFGLLTPANGSTGMAQTQILRWKTLPDANSYDFEFGTSAKFEPGSILYSDNGLTVDSFKIGVQLEKAKAYFWRVRPVNECGQHDWSEPFFFSTLVDNCSVTTADDLPKSLTSNGTPTIESKVTVLTPGIVSVLNVKQLRGYHESFKDLDVRLVSPSGTEVLLFRNKCGSIQSTFVMGFSDDAPNTFQCPPSSIGLNVKPQNPLAAFAGQSVTGTWTLKVKDQTSGSGGVIEGLQLEFCSSASLNPPFVVNNNVLTLDPGTNKTIDAPLLLVEDANNTHAQLIYTLLTVPKNGRLERNGSVLVPGDQFPQTAIDNGELRFFDYGHNAGADNFKFIVYDGEGGWLGTTQFNIQPAPVGTSEAAQKIGFALFPNPATDVVTLAFERPVAADTRIHVFNVGGQMLRAATLGAGSDRLQIPLGQLPEGVYMVSVQNSAGTGVRKLVVRR